MTAEQWLAEVSKTMDAVKCDICGHVGVDVEVSMSESSVLMTWSCGNGCGFRFRFIAEQPIDYDQDIKRLRELKMELAE
jgi:hypothetical protein